MRMNEELIEKLRSMNDERKELLRDWLSHGKGHSNMPPEWFIKRGVPSDFMEDKVSRQWSNFVFAPKGCDKVALASYYDYPIGYIDDAWQRLITPREMERGYLQRWNHNKQESHWVDENEWVTMFNALPEEVKEQHSTVSRFNTDDGWLMSDYEAVLREMFKHEESRPHWFQHHHSPHVHHISWDTSDARNAYLLVELNIRVVPSKNYEGEDILFSSPTFFLTRMVGGRRVDYINVGMVWNKVIVELNHKGLNEDEIDKYVDETRKKYKEDESIITIGGDNLVSAEQWRTLSKRELMRIHLNDREEELEYIAQRRDEWEAEAPGVIKYVYDLLVDADFKSPEHHKELQTDTPLPAGWSLELAYPLGYVDCMWNGNYFVPWVDGSSSTGIITCICNELGVDTDSGMMGRGSHASVIGERLLEKLVEVGVMKP
jgi:hypothetical protein